MTVDEKVKNYLDRALELSPTVTHDGKTFKTWTKQEVIEIAKMIQLEDHKQVSKKKRQRNDKDVYFDYDEVKWYNLDSDFIKNMIDLHKDKDILKEMEKMTGWLVTRPHKKNFKRFIANWLNKDKRY
jgi:hypothetical protein